MILGTFHFMQVIMLIILAALIAYYTSIAIKYYKKKNNKEIITEEKPREESANEGDKKEKQSKKAKPKRTSKVTLGIIVVILIGLTLPFHYLPQHGRVLVKANLTFKNTIVTNSDIERIVKQYNNASFMQQVQMRQDPFIQTLMESGVLFESGVSR
jgi:mannitol-specific phosphotransferase system IIBC component